MPREVAYWGYIARFMPREAGQRRLLGLVYAEGDKTRRSLFIVGLFSSTGFAQTSNFVRLGTAHWSSYFTTYHVLSSPPGKTTRSRPTTTFTVSGWNGPNGTTYARSLPTRHRSRSFYYIAFSRVIPTQRARTSSMESSMSTGCMAKPILQRCVGDQYA